MEPPNPLSGNHPLVPWLNKLREFSLASSIRTVNGGRLLQDTRGQALEIPSSAGGSGIAGLYRLQTVEGDYLVCHKFDGSTEDTSTDVNIALAFELRESRTSEALTYLATTTATAWSCAFTFADSEFYENRKQSADDTGGMGDPEYRYVTPIWQPGVTLIWAIRCDHTGVTVSGSELTLLDLNVAGRVWAKEFAPPA